MSLIRIGIDYRPALLLRSGIGRYVTNLVRHLPAVDEEVSLALFSVFWSRHAERLAAAPVEESRRVRLAAARFPGRALNALGRFTPLSAETWTKPVDVFHFTDYVPLPVRTRANVFTLHDLGYLHDPGFHGPANTRRLTAVARRLVSRSRIILAVSETTKADAVARYDIPEDRVVVTPLGVDESFFLSPARREGERPYILMIGTLEPRKNVPRTLRAFQRFLEKGGDADLVIVGRRGWLCDDVFALLGRSPWNERVRYLGEVDDERLRELLAGCAVLAYPSLWEGFGLPVLEGMAAGVPVLTSSRGAMREVAGDGAHLVDPEDEGDIADGLETLLSDPARAADLARRGVARARTFTWDECARRTVAAYRRAVAEEEG